VVVVNPAAGPALAPNPADELRAALPGAEVVELGPDDDVDAVVAAAAGRARVLGVAGGDGTVNAAAAAALRADRPLLAVPGGTLNHFCHALGVETVADAVDAVRQGACTWVSVGELGGRPFLNTASFGAYTDLVDERERLEHRIGKWPAMAVAMVRVLRRGAPVRVELDGVERELWMVFLGNGPYEPAGFAPSWRPRLDTGLIDVRLVDARHPWCRTRLVGALLVGRLARTAVYRRWVTSELEVRSLEGPLRLARDGETFDGGTHVVVRTRPERLRVLVPDPDR
jgi:undecaprenyl-diphosphatase